MRTPSRSLAVTCLAQSVGAVTGGRSIGRWCPGLPPRRALLAGLMLLALAGVPGCADDVVIPPAAMTTPVAADAAQPVVLPAPVQQGGMALNEALARRRSQRDLDPVAEIGLAEVSQMVWAAQGINAPGGYYRTAPSAGALYPLEVLVAAGRVASLPAGVYRYRPAKHDLMPVATGDPRRGLVLTSYGQQAWIGSGSALIVIAGVTERTAKKYGDRAERYVANEAGHAAQNVLLMAAALGLKAGIVGAFDDDAVRRLLCLAADEKPWLVMPVGR